MRHQLSAAAIIVALGGVGAAGCRSAEQPLGPADAYLVMAAKGAAAGAGLPLVEEVPMEDARAAPLHKQVAVGFGGEILRTDYLLKQFHREAMVEGRTLAPEARAAAAEPTIFVLDAPARDGLGLATPGFWGRPHAHPRVPWMRLDADLERDSALGQTLAGQLGRRIATAVSSGSYLTPVPAADSGGPLVEGYALAMEVIGREWRVGEGPQGAIAPDAGTERQRERFASVRQNRYVVSGDGGPLRSAQEMLSDAGVAATVIYRLAQSKSVGRRIAPKDLYAPFVSNRIPDGVSPAAVLGPFRNFQAKLLAAWGRAVVRGRPPRDIAELVEAYGRELPAEKGEAFRILVVTTFGATVKAGGVAVDRGDQSLPELTALAAEAAAGRRGLKDALAVAAPRRDGAEK